MTTETRHGPNSTRLNFKNPNRSDPDSFRHTSTERLHLDDFKIRLFSLFLSISCLIKLGVFQSLLCFARNLSLWHSEKSYNSSVHYTRFALATNSPLVTSFLLMTQTFIFDAKHGLDLKMYPSCNRLPPLGPMQCTIILLQRSLRSQYQGNLLINFRCRIILTLF